MSNTIQLLGQNYNVQYHYNDLTTISELQSYLPIADLNKHSQLKEDIGKTELTTQSYIIPLQTESSWFLTVICA